MGQSSGGQYTNENLMKNLNPFEAMKQGGFINDAGSAIESWFKPSKAEDAYTSSMEMQSQAFKDAMPTLSKYLGGELPQGVVDRVKGYGADIADQQTGQLASRFNTSGMWGSTGPGGHQQGEVDLRSNIARQTQESLSDLQFRMQSSALSGILGMGTPNQQMPTWMQTATGIAGGVDAIKSIWDK